MGPVLVLLLAALQPLWALSWDVAVALEGGNLHLLEEGTSIGSLFFKEFSNARGLVYLADRDLFLFTNSDSHVNFSIFQLKINKDNLNASQIFPLVIAKNETRWITGLVYDQLKQQIYWTDTVSKSIFKANISSASAGLVRADGLRLVQHFSDEEPHALALDFCNRKMFWSNTNSDRPSIKSFLLDDESLVQTNVLNHSSLTAPNGLAVDWREHGFLYWTDDLDGILYAIGGSRPDGSNRTRLHKGRHHVPGALAILDHQNLLWADNTDRHVYKMSRAGNDPISYFDGHRKLPVSIVVRSSSFQAKDLCAEEISASTSTETTVTSVPTTIVTSALVPIPSLTTKSSIANLRFFCLNNGEKNNIAAESCHCRPGFSGPHCEVDLCYNYCLAGSCDASGGQPTCLCPLGKSGKRCEVDLCSICLNGGLCRPLTNSVKCHCSEEFEGERCETKKTSTSTHAPLSSFAGHQQPGRVNLSTVEAMAGLCVVLVALVAFLSYKVCQLKRRPRLKKRVIVSRREVTPSFLRPPSSVSGQTDSCEITIENCCNMNICETPCFEPPNRLGRKMRKEDKKTLLANMEDSDVEEQDASISKDSS